MQFSSILALAAFAASATAYSNHTTEYVTEVVTAYTTVCPVATEIVHGTVTYTVSAHETLTVTNCPCTIVKPVITSSVVVCHNCATGTAVPPMYTNGTGPIPTYHAPGPVATLSLVPTFAPHATASPAPIEANSGNKIFALSGASLAGLVAVAAFVL